MNTPIVSILIAAHQAQDFIAEAVASACAQSLREIEIIVAPDEPADYGFLGSLDPRVHVLAGVPHPTGPGLARNRALAAARGRFIALLDADDLISPDYLSSLLPLAERRGAAFGRTCLTDWDGNMLREVRGKNGAVGFDDFATAFASLHGIARNMPERRWRDELAEDVLFDMETLALAGGTAPFAEDAVYRLRLRPQSMTRGRTFTQEIGAGYDRLKQLIRSGQTLIPLAQRDAAIAVFDRWQQMNMAFAAASRQDPTLDYQTFAAAQIGAAPNFSHQ